MAPSFSFPAPVLNGEPHPFVTCVCGNLRHDSNCPLSGTCPFCGLYTTTCMVLGRCEPLFHPVRCNIDDQRRKKHMEHIIAQCDRFGGLIHGFHRGSPLPLYFLSRVAALNARYTAVKSRSSSSVSNLKEMEYVLAKLRRLYIEVKAFRTAQPAMPVLPVVPVLPVLPAMPVVPVLPVMPVVPAKRAKPAQPAQPAKQSKKAKLAGIAKPADN